MNTNYQDLILWIDTAFNSGKRFYRVVEQHACVSGVWKSVLMGSESGHVEVTEDMIQKYRIDESITDEMIDQFCQVRYGHGITEVSPTAALCIAEDLSTTIGKDMAERVGDIRDRAQNKLQEGVYYV